jgi:hypothetical protein
MDLKMIDYRLFALPKYGLHPNFSKIILYKNYSGRLYLSRYRS